MLKKVLIIIMLVVALLVGGFMTTYDLSHATIGDKEYITGR